MSDTKSEKKDTKLSLTTGQFVQVPSLGESLGIIETKAKDGDFHGLLDIGHVLIEQGRMRGKLLAKVLYEFQQNWPTLAQVAGLEGSDVLEFLQTEFSLNPQTITKYTTMWGRLFGADSSVPESIRPALLEGPTENLLLASPLSEDKPTKKEWIKIANAIGDKQKIREIVRGKRGKKTSAKNALHLSIDKSGKITAWRGDEKPAPLGLLKLDGKTPLHVDGVERILRLAGIARK